MQRNNGGAERSRVNTAFGSAARARILVVDDESDACEALQQVLEGEGYHAIAETSAHRALAKVANEAFDLVITDISMAEMSGLDLCRRLLELRPELPVVMVTGRGDMSTVVAALRLGARDFLTKPIDAHAVLASVNSALLGAPKHRHLRTVEAPSLVLAKAVILGRSPAIQRVYSLIQDLSGSLASVLIQGETGTGKERIARALHENSRLCDGPFVAVDCASISPGLLESELFGHARGAFTDAKAARTGLLLQANGGTLLLDEIGELPLAMQPKLLRALQERRVRPVGQSNEVPFDCRIIAATNRDLEREVAERRFREDLYYRINVITVEVPALRARGDDVLLLAEHFLDHFAHGRKLKLTAATREKLLAYDWPGNVRELENCIERAAALCEHDELALEDLPEKVRLGNAKIADVGAENSGDGAAVDPAMGDVWPALASLSEFERAHILNALELLHGNKARAAKLLGLDLRTLCRRLEQYRDQSAARS